MLQAQGIAHLIEELFGWGLGLHRENLQVVDNEGGRKYNIYK